MNHRESVIKSIQNLRLRICQDIVSNQIKTSYYILSVEDSLIDETLDIISSYVSKGPWLIKESSPMHIFCDIFSIKILSDKVKDQVEKSIRIFANDVTNNDIKSSYTIAEYEESDNILHIVDILSSYFIGGTITYLESTRRITFTPII